ncbi:hypothetical protein WJX81_005933 [Elliptochloris bilobata]|uniref:Uncharacterized protein n=1 Tax=Elliptochloris bilobata TaxID=381761 RepID=A0AAW1QV75_9CHLO
MTAIKPIDRGSVHRICSGQVILDLGTAVKELVENSLDAGATNIEVRLKEYGSELIEVADNGCGIRPDNYQALTLKYHTSKLRCFTDLQELSTFGFRGEALSSLCALADVSVVTRTTDGAAGVRLTYDHAGKLMGTAATARAPGTTVAVRELFKHLPVRFKEFRRNVKREYAKLLAVLQAYALIATSVRIICTNHVGRAARTTVVSTQGSPTLRENIVTVFGSRVADGLEPLIVEGPSGATISGYVSKATAGSSKSAGDRLFFFLNGRPIDLPKGSRVVTDTYRSLSSAATAHCRPVAILDLQLPRHSYDINVTPDKRKTFLHHEDELLNALQKALQELWEPSRSTFAINNVVRSSQQQLITHTMRPTPDEDAADIGGSAGDEEPEPPIALGGRTPGASETGPAGRDACEDPSAQRHQGREGHDTGAAPMEEDLPQQREHARSSAHKPSSSSGQRSCPATTQPTSQPGNGQRDLLARVDLPALLQRLQRAQAGRANAPAECSSSDGCSFCAASMQGSEPCAGPEADAAAACELEAVFCKADFARMRVLGQFNLGFILARLGRDLFIVDQHASDEKYNFERLQRSTLLLSAVPFSKDVTFGPTDVQELSQLLRSGTTAGQPVVRPSRVRAMLAMRACRSSIMIGKPLDKARMQRVLQHLSELDSPWNCPHGRPTMRHLTRLLLCNSER